MMLHKQFIRRQLTQSKNQSLIFVLCVALSIVTLVALSSFRENINNTLIRDAKQLHAGDIILESRYEFSPALVTAVNQLEQQSRVEAVNIYEFYSVVRVADGEATLLSDLKVVEPGYPFYGQVKLQSGQPLHQVLQPGQIIVEQNLLARLDQEIGDRLKIGQATLTIADVVLHEPDRPVNFFSLGPRIFIAAADLESLDLLKPGSRVEYVKLLKVYNEGALNELADQLRAVALPDQEEVDTFRTAGSGLQRFFNNFLFFLSLIGIFTLMLAGIGIQSSLNAFLRERDKTVAIIKTVGASNRFVFVHYLLVVSMLGISGTLIGLSLGFLLQALFPWLLADLLPPNVQLSISGSTIIQSLLLGFVVVTAFTFLPLYQLQDLKPRLILHNEIGPLKRRWPYYLTIGLMGLFFGGIILWQMEDWWRGGAFLAGVIGLIIIATLITNVTLFLLRRWEIKSLLVRQALRGLFRPRNATKSIIITLSVSLTVIFTIYLVEQNLDLNLVQSYPEDSPNLFFLDIQPSQLTAFAEELGMETTFYPIVRANIIAVNGQPIDREAEREGRGDSLARTFNLTYRESLLDNEDFLAGDSLFREDWAGPQVSLLEGVLEIREFEIGDMITFRIQGVPVEAQVSSIRQLTSESIEPFFYFVLPPEVLQNAPQSIFTAVRVPEETVPRLQNRLVAAFPNVTAVNVTAVIATFAEVVRRLSQIIRFLTLFSIFAGILIIISSVFATRLARVQEAVYFKVLGATSRFVLQLFTLENLFLGLISGLVALLMSQIGSWLITVWIFEIDYHPFVGASLLMVGLTMGLVTVVGLSASISILRQRPIVFLREQTQE